MSDKASSTNPNLTWELSNRASASIRRDGGSNSYQLCVAYRNSDSSEDVIHPLIISAGLYLKNIIYAISAAHLTNWYSRYFRSRNCSIIIFYILI